MKSASFKTGARTVDHLGREQIADCPTAVSELWKNAYDAYARNVSLEVFSTEPATAVMLDDGHGMDVDDVLDRRLIIGTESKASGNIVPKHNRQGLPPRIKQGRKGIGRLSCANLGPLVLVVSKRRESSFVACLVDWRMFQNPYLNLSDIEIPIVETERLSDVFLELPSLKSRLISCITGNEVSSNDNEQRLTKAWERHDGELDLLSKIRSENIKKSIEDATFDVEQLANWHAGHSKDGHGTVLMISDINYDLRALLQSPPHNPAISRTIDVFRETLHSFVDPYAADTSDIDNEFNYSVKVQRDLLPTLLLGSEKAFGLNQLEGMEHCIEGEVDDAGVFNGRVKVFGQWLSQQSTIKPPSDLPIPTRKDTFVGPFKIYIASMEFGFRNSTHDKADHERFTELAKQYAGFMVFRDGLRVLPYGRADNDFFEIESRRTRHAGREFWNHRQMFGRVAISRDQNPNLIDKAGREGLIDNRAAKALRDIVDHILMSSARQYFGTDSEFRKERLPEVQDTKDKLRAAENRKRLREKNRRSFGTLLKEQLNFLPALIDDLQSNVDRIKIRSDQDVVDAQELLADFRVRLPIRKIPGAPRSMPERQRNNYVTYQQEAHEARMLFEELSAEIDDKIETYSPSDPLSLLTEQAEKAKRRFQADLRKRTTQVENLQKQEFSRVRALAESRKGAFEDEVQSTIQLFEIGRKTFADASKLVSVARDRLLAENDEIFEPYIRSLEALRESIDLETLATSGMEDAADLRSELDRLNGLAQLGVAVEITGHDLQDFDDIISSGLKRLPEDVADTKAVRDIRLGYEGLTDQLRFLSPLRMAGTKVERWIDGREIADYVRRFFAPVLARESILLEATEAFEKFRVFDQPSRLYPVFINLVNNSIYWLSTSKRPDEDRNILLDAREHKIFVSDNGPGISDEDIDSLFKLFFTRRVQGGRGVGLYLSRANLKSGGHDIHYVKGSDLPLDGANFAISFRGAEFSDR